MDKRDNSSPAVAAPNLLDQPSAPATAVALEPCPFCGGGGEGMLYLRVERTPSKKREVPFYVCGQCAAEGAKPLGSWEIGQGKSTEAQRSAAIAWNGRRLPERLWIWRNGPGAFVAYRHLYPRMSPPNGDPCVLGEPAGYAIVKPSFSNDPRESVAAEEQGFGEAEGTHHG